MLFNSIQFLIFLPLVIGLYFLISKRYKWIVLLLASVYFYFSLKPEFVLVMLLAILFNYLIARYLEISNNYALRKKVLVLAIIFNIGTLVAFKYLSFLTLATRQLIYPWLINFNEYFINLALPIGISFYTFQNIGYIADVYNKKINAEKNIGIYATYVLYFPKFISGPLERAGNLIPQFRKEHKFEYARVIDGCKRIVWGFFKKLVIADRIAFAVNFVFINPANHDGYTLIATMVLFGFQLYFDFSGYTDIALGVSKIFGIYLSENFRRPYLAKSVAEFWRRWHISLSSWFQDYVFVPLYLFISRIKVFSKLSSTKKHIAAFSISIFFGQTLLGLWHGANWTFAVFGLYYGVLMALYFLFKKKWDSFNSYIQIIATFMLVTASWVFFKSNSLSEALAIFIRIIQDILRPTLPALGIRWTEVFIAVSLILIMMFFEISEEKEKNLGPYSQWQSYLGYALLAIIILIFGVFQDIQFMYVGF